MFLDSFDLFLLGSSGGSTEAEELFFREGTLDEWACSTSSLATDSATDSSQVLSKEEVRRSSGVEPQTIFAFRFCNFEGCEYSQYRWELID